MPFSSPISLTDDLTKFLSFFTCLHLLVYFLPVHSNYSQILPFMASVPDEAEQLQQAVDWVLFFIYQLPLASARTFFLPTTVFVGTVAKEWYEDLQVVVVNFIRETWTLQNFELRWNKLLEWDVKHSGCWGFADLSMYYNFSVEKKWELCRNTAAYLSTKLRPAKRLYKSATVNSSSFSSNNPDCWSSSLKPRSVSVLLH